tara:strand:+ start:1334 stop:2710 length:1377 start_codon:yes stop_codon:yes gene_type:complete
MEFFSPQNVFKGQVSIEGAITADNHAVTKTYLEANAVVGIATDSANYAELVTVNGEKQLKLKPLTITDVSVDTTQTSLANWISANYTSGDEKQEGDIIVLTGVSGRAETYIHNGGTAGNANDWAEIEGADVTDAEVRGALSASSGINYNSATGAFTADQAEIRGFFAAGTGLSYDSSNGTYQLSVDSDGIAEGSANLYFTQARSRGSISVSGGGISYNSGTGVITLAANTSHISESGNLYFTDARSRAALSLGAVSGPDVQLLEYDASNGQMKVRASQVFGQFAAGTGLSYADGVYSLNATTSNVAEGSRLYYTDARSRAAISVSGGGISYNNSTGAITLAVGSDDISEQSTNLFFTNARARSAVSADAAAGNMLTYDSSTGAIRVAKSAFRSTFAPQNLGANTFVTLNHGLGEKIVHVSAYDASGNLIQLDVQLTDANNCKVKSINAVNNLEIVVSL